MERQEYWNAKRVVTIVILVGAVIMALAFGGKIFETVERGTYHVKQAAVSGDMSVITDSGTYFQNFGDITVWPRVKRSTSPLIKKGVRATPPSACSSRTAPTATSAEACA